MPSFVIAGQTYVDVEGGLEKEWRKQYDHLQEQLQRRDEIHAHAPQSCHQDSLILPADVLDPDTLRRLRSRLRLEGVARPLDAEHAA